MDPKHISRNKVDYLLILSWNIKDEIIKQERFFLKKEQFPIKIIIKKMLKHGNKV